MTNKKLLTTREAAMVIGVHPETLRRWDRSGYLVASRLGMSNHRRYHLSELSGMIKPGVKVLRRMDKLFPYHGKECALWENDKAICSCGLMKRVRAIIEAELARRSIPNEKKS